MKPWWERFPGLYDREIAALDKHGIVHTRVEKAWREGRVVFELTVKRESQAPLQLTAYYPATFPYTRFDVVAAGLDLPRHQNPFAKNLCLLGRATENWSVSYTLGDVLTAQLPKILKFESNDPRTLRDLEEPQGEPFTEYYVYHPQSAVLVDSSWRLDPKLTSGRLKALYCNALPFRGAITELQDSSGATLQKADGAISKPFPHAARGRWVRWHEPILENNPARIVALLCGKYKEVRQFSLIPRQRIVSHAQIEVLGVVFPEEVQQSKQDDGWIFIVRTAEGLHLARACRAGRDDLMSRAPELAVVRHKRIAVVGMGSVGAPSAIEFARNGAAQLKIADHDFVEAGTIARWPIGLSAVGKSKVHAVDDFIATNYPHTRVEKFYGMIGRSVPTPEYDDVRDLDHLLDVDLIYDATAETGIQLLLADRAAEDGIPYLCVSTTPGAWGGLIFLQRPGVDTCWSCLQHALTDGSIPTPPMDPLGMLQPIGCANPTFTGASFDVQAISFMAVRTAVSMLCADTPGGYPGITWNVAVARFRTLKGEILPPQWDVYTIGRHANCRNEVAHRNPLDPQKAT